MSLGGGTVYVASMKQKLNKVSTNEAELVDVVDGMPKIVCTQMLMESQGYNMKEMILHMVTDRIFLMHRIYY